MIEIPLTTTQEPAIIDDEDSDLIKLSKWYFHNPNGVYSTNKRPVKLIRVIAERKLGRPLRPYEKCRHINRNKLDNRRSNVEVKPPPPIFNGEYFTISLSQGKTAMLDKVDVDLSLVKWSFSPTGYACRNIGSSRKGSKIIYLHRIVLERILDRPIADEESVDHANRDKLDNRRSNLRVATATQNSCNQRRTPANASSIYKGVLLQKQVGNWIARIKSNGISYHLGCFDTEIEAAKAYDKAAIEHHKEFASLNFPT